MLLQSLRVLSLRIPKLRLKSLLVPAPTQPGAHILQPTALSPKKDQELGELH